MLNRARTLQCLAAIAAAVLAGGCAHVEPGAQAARTDGVLITGSRVPQHTDLRGGIPATIGNVRIYSREDLQGTGQSTLSASLRNLSPDLD